MAFFRSFQQSLPSVSSILDSVSTAVDDLASAVGDVTYTVSDQLAEQVTTLMSKVQTEEEEEESTQRRKEEAERQASSHRSRCSQARAEEEGGRSARSDKTSATSGRHQNPAEGGRGEGRRNRGTRKAEEGGAEAGAGSDALVEDDRSHSGPKGKSQKHGGDSEKDAASPSDERGLGGKRRESRGEIDSSPGVTRKDRQVPNRETANGVHQRDSGSESPSPKSKIGKDKARDLTKENEEGKRKEEWSPEKEKTFDPTRADDKETGESDEESKSPKLEKEEEDKEKKEAARASKCQKGSSRNDSGKRGDGTKKQKSRQKPGKDGDLWQSSSESESERTKRPAESACHSQAGQHGADPLKQHSFGWETQQSYSLQSTQYEGYSSEASTEDANCIQRMSLSPPLEEQQPPPYQDNHGSPSIPRVPRALADTRHGNRDRPRRGCCGAGRRSRAKRPDNGSDDRDTEGHSKEPEQEREQEQKQEREQEEDAPSDSTAVLGQEDTSAHGSALLLSKGYEPEPLAKYGTLDVAFDYDPGEQRLAVTVTAVTDIPALRRTGNVSWQVHLVLLPTKQQRAKTGVRKGPCPVFTETFKFSCVESETIGSYAVRFRLYSVRRMRKERVMGEKVFYLTKLNLQGKMSVPVTLDPGCTLTGCGSVRSVSCSEGVSSYRSAGQASRPEILLGLLYNSTTGRLSVEVIKGSHLRDIAPDKPPTLSDGLFCCLKHLIGGQLYIIPDTYVKLAMMNSMGQEMSKCKTSTCRGQPDPAYKETFVFQVALFQLSEVTLLASVYSRRGVKRRDRVGWVSLGLNTSGEMETSHWAQMREAEGQQVCRWHTLLDS